MLVCHARNGYTHYILRWEAFSHLMLAHQYLIKQCDLRSIEEGNTINPLQTILFKRMFTLLLSVHRWWVYRKMPQGREDSILGESHGGGEEAHAPGEQVVVPEHHYSEYHGVIEYLPSPNSKTLSLPCSFSVMFLGSISETF